MGEVRSHKTAPESLTKKKGSATMFQKLKSRRRREVRCGILNLSKLIWTEEAEPDAMGRSVFLISAHDWRDKKKDAFRVVVCCGEFELEDTDCQNYLAVIRKEGGYSLEEVEEHLEVWEGYPVPHTKHLDVLRLPDEMNGMKFKKIPADQQKSGIGHIRPRWGYGVIRARDFKRKVWQVEEHR